MKLLHKIKFWLAQKRGLVAKKKSFIAIARIDIETRRKILEEQYLIETDPGKKKIIDEEYRSLDG